MFEEKSSWVVRSRSPFFSPKKERRGLTAVKTIWGEMVQKVSSGEREGESILKMDFPPKFGTVLQSDSSLVRGRTCVSVCVKLGVSLDSRSFTAAAAEYTPPPRLNIPLISDHE
jgi:hypothetical protein